ncbi:MAG: cupin domain-containing protein [Candidatus Aminicenantes bacterium]|nr:cupin domain-containing protein [Candidatus Aminicenantes bacterium]
MFIKDVKNGRAFTAGDGSHLKEIFNPVKEKLAFRYSLAWAEVPARGATRPHRLTSSEVYFILEGEGEMHIDAEREAIGPGRAVYIPPGARQWVENTGRGELRFLCLVDPAWRPEDEEILA